MHKLIRTARDTTPARHATKKNAHFAPWLVLAAVGCAHSGAGVREAHGAAATKPSVAAQVSVSEARDYATETPQGDVLTVKGAPSSHEREIRDALLKACKKARLTPDPRLGQVALAVAQGSDFGEIAPRGSFVSYLGQRAGLVEPTPQIWLSAATRADMLSAAIEPSVREVASAAPLTHCGGALLTTEQGSVLAVAFSGRFLTLHQDLPRSLPRPAYVPLNATLAQTYHHPALAITYPDGRVERVPLPAQKKIKHLLQFDAAGIHQVELLAEGPQGMAVLAVIPLRVGDAPEPAAPPFEAGETESDASGVIDRLYTLIDAERKARKLPTLKRDRKLSKIALAHSEDMDAHHFVAHSSKSTGTASDRVTRAGLTPNLVLENIGRGYSASEIHEGLMASPGHRANLIHPDATHIGLGVVVQREGDRLAFLVTQVFVAFPR